MAFTLPLKKSDHFKRTLQDILPSTFFLMKNAGLWKPLHSTSFLIKVYIVFTTFTMFTMITVGLSLVCVILLSSENIKEAIVENSFLLFTLFNGWVKAIIILLRRKDILSLLNKLLEERFLPLDDVELEMQKKFDREAETITHIYTTLVGIAVISMYLSIFWKNEDEQIELLNAWRPYNLNVKLYFWITWIHEFVGHFVTAIVHISIDTLIPGLMLQLCCQLRFLGHRLNNLPYQIEQIRKSSNFYMDKQEFEKFFISATIKHHNSIFQFAKKTKNIFMEVLFIQFTLSLFIICFSGYKISKGNNLDYSTEITLYTYACCMLMQLFLFCWYGNELMLNSSNLHDAISETNWLCLEERTKKSLIIMMIRCRKPISISAGSVIFVNLNSFVTILKASYSAYNVLQHSA